LSKASINTLNLINTFTLLSAIFKHGMESNNAGKMLTLDAVSKMSKHGTQF